MQRSNQVKLVQPGDELVIETGVPLPGHGGRSPLILAFHELAKAQNGASFFIPPSVCKVGGQIAERASRVGGKGWVSVRRVEGGFRAWKVGDAKLRDA